MPLLPWFSTPAPQEPPKPEPKPPPPALDEKIFSQLEQRLEDIPQPLLFVLSGILLAGAGAYTHRRFFRRLRTAEWITPDVFAQRRWIKGVVTSVGDADNFRLYHTPGFGWRWPVKFRGIPSNTKELKDQTIHIRIAGVDAPEAAHFGRASQPYSAESLAWLKNQILGKTLYCQLVRRDQYARVVSIVMQSPRVLPGSLVWGKSLALEMLRAGWATTYEQAGAEYGKWGKEEFLRIEAQAKASRRGMWKDGVNIETPAQYKRRYAAADVESATASEKGTELKPDKPRWWRRLWWVFRSK